MPKVHSVWNASCLAVTFLLPATAKSDVHFLRSKATDSNEKPLGQMHTSQISQPKSMLYVHCEFNFSATLNSIV